MFWNSRLCGSLVQEIYRRRRVVLLVEQQINAEHAAFELVPVETVDLKAVYRRLERGVHGISASHVLEVVEQRLPELTEPRSSQAFHFHVCVEVGVRVGEHDAQTGLEVNMAVAAVGLNRTR